MDIGKRKTLQLLTGFWDIGIPNHLGILVNRMLHYPHTSSGRMGYRNKSTARFEDTYR